MIKNILTSVLMFLCVAGMAEDGHRLWLRFDKIENEVLRKTYLEQLNWVYVEGSSEVIETAKKELLIGLKGLLGCDVDIKDAAGSDQGLSLGIIGETAWFDGMISASEKEQVHKDGFIILTRNENTIIAAKDDKGLLYGTFHFLRLLQRHQPIKRLHIIENPKINIRILNHWDNLDRTVERGYAGFSIWNWHELPGYIDQNYIEYARANASIGINGAVVTNVNANALVFRKDYLTKAQALANVFRAYGLKLYLTARFSAPIELGGLKTADPKDAEVMDWWQKKAKEIYTLIPDFGGFLVKANSEGQPGPQDYDRNHADGANMLADAVAPFGGVVMWRAFVYSHEVPDDRAKQAYDEFMPLDGKFRDNVLIQVKNGAIDFQPREPFHPLFGGMQKTPVMMEFQITKEYLGQGTHVVGLSKLYEEVLQADTYAKGEGSIVAKVIDGSLYGHELSGIAGVSNIGTARNWTGNLFGQADWYAFGKLAWNPYASSGDIFKEWSELTFSHDPKSIQIITDLLDNSREACVNYMTPLGLHHIMGAGHHYGPGPWVSDMPRVDWTSIYYHKADSIGIGFERTHSGSNALAQYNAQFRVQVEDVTTCPEQFLLWFHHVPWDFKLKSGKTLWDELCLHYQQGVRQTELNLVSWDKLQSTIDPEKFMSVRQHLSIQTKEAAWWRDACLAYFQTFSHMDLPDGVPTPAHNLDYYKNVTFPYAPGISPKW